MIFNKNIKQLFCLSICLLILNLHCKKEEITDNTYFKSKVVILGHRGMGLYYKMPGNTYESICPAIGIGADGCEMDVQLTKDSVLILYHDKLLKPLTTCSGRIYDLNWDEVQECEYYAVKNNIFVNSVEELFSKLPDVSNLYFSFDCKIDYESIDYIVYQQQMLRAIKRLCEKYNMNDHIFIEGRESFLNMARDMGLSNKLFLSGALNESNIETAVNNQFFGICNQIDDFEDDADVAHATGLYVMTYSPVNYYLNMYAINKKIDILQTDDLISILREFNRYNYDYIIP
ncbi:MAG: glycerophosphodiester phosphodiesterase family protein [Bacteroidota bacterium]